MFLGAGGFVGVGCDGLQMDKLLVSRCTDLRYLLVFEIYHHEEIVSVDELIESLEFRGFAIKGRPSKTVSDALRTDIKLGRVYRRGRGRYGPGEMPRATEYRIHRRVMELRAQAAALSGGDECAA